MMSDIPAPISQLIKQYRLPKSYWELVQDYIQPLSQLIANQRKAMGKPMVVGINGGQGSGKSTLAQFLKSLLESKHRYVVVVLSQDDFYLGKAQRQQLAQSIHPLLATRGVPGTHDVDLALKTLSHLVAGEEVSLPQFDKALDDCVPVGQWPRQTAPVDIILLEGWCVGAQPQSLEQLAEPINTLEKNEDSQCLWRSYVNQCLAQSYQQWFSRIDYSVMLKVPDFDSVYQWRNLQEKKLHDHYRFDNPTQDMGQIMDSNRIQRFVQHFERITLHQLATMPEQANVVFHLNRQHGIDSAQGLKN